MKEIEKKIKDDANNASFEFKEEYWDETLIKLKQAERKSIIKRFFWIFGFALLIGGTSYFAWESMNNSGNQSFSDTALIEPIKSDRVEIDSENKNTISTINNNSKKQKILDSNSNSLLNYNQDVVNSNSSSNSLTPSNRTNKSQDNLNISLTNRASITSEISKPNSSKPVNRFVENNNSIPSEENNSSNNMTPTSSNSFIPSNEIANTSLPKSNENINLISLEFQKIELPDIYINLIDSIITKFDPAEIPVLVNNPIKKLSLQAFAGGIVHKKFNTDKGSNLTLPYMGLELSYKFSQPLSISTGIGYYQLSMNPLEISIQDKTYGFGLEHNSAKLSLEKSNWLEIPLKLSYNLIKGHFVGLGGEYSFLISAKNSISHELVFTNEGNVEIPVSTKTLISEDYKKYSSFYSNSFSVFCSYQYQYNRFGARIKYHYGLVDIIDNEFLLRKSDEFSHRFSFTINYSIF